MAPMKPIALRSSWRAYFDLFRPGDFEAVIPP